MSENAPARPAYGVTRAWRRTPLSVRLVAGVLLLVVLALGASGAVAAATLRGYLVQRVDEQLHAASAQIAHEAGELPDGDEGPGGHERGRLPSAFVTEVLDQDGTPVSEPSNELLDSSQSLPDFPRLRFEEAAERAGQPFTVGSERGGGSWRVRAVPLDDGSGTLLVAVSLEDVSATVARLEELELVIGLCTLALVALAGTLVVRAALRPLRAVEDTAEAIAGGDLSRRVPAADPRTEVGRLGGAINVMLTRIEKSFRAQAASEEEARHSEERMRRFVADASHELRTPLTSIRGFAELHRMQHGRTSPEEVTRWMQRIETEANRMGLLVEDLLLLARLDQERPLVREPVDLLGVAADVVHDSRVRAPERQLNLVREPAGDPPIVTGDAARLHQVVTNLVDNALRHTPRDTPVEVHVGVDGAEALLEVVDHGPGLSTEEAAHVFERFYRADPARSRSRHEGGAGLGLAIVAALVTGHGGTVEADRTPGGGATFRVRLPLAPSR